MNVKTGSLPQSLGKEVLAKSTLLLALRGASAPFALTEIQLRAIRAGAQGNGKWRVRLLNLFLGLGLPDFLDPSVFWSEMSLRNRLGDGFRIDLPILKVRSIGRARCFLCLE